MFELKIDLGEWWWGGRASDGVGMPFDTESELQIDLKDNRSNQNSPFFVSSHGRYFWSDQPFEMTVKQGVICCSGPGPMKFSEGHGDLRSAFLDARALYFPPPADIPAPLLFTAPQYNTWIELMYEQEESSILDYAQRLLDEGYPPGVLMIDDNWQEDYGVWDFHPGRFRDPAGMVKKLQAMGFQVMLWVCPFLSPDSMTCREVQKAGGLLLDDAGEPRMIKWWNGYSAVLDLTRDPGRHWFEQQLQTLQQRYGVDGYKFDAGDPPFYPVEGHRHCEAFNRLGAVFPLNEYRAAWKCADLPLAQRLADRCHAWDETGLASVVPNLLAQGMIGHPFVCPDMIGGGQFESFLGEGFSVDQELVVRYAQAAALCPMMQFSVAPWRILDDSHAELCQRAAQLHAQFGEEILEMARRAAETGNPILRPMEYQFPGHGYAPITDQFMLDDTLLVAPVLQPQQRERKVAVPPGRWKDDRGEVFEGPAEVQMPAPLERLIYLRRDE